MRYPTVSESRACRGQHSPDTCLITVLGTFSSCLVVDRELMVAGSRYGRACVVVESRMRGSARAWYVQRPQIVRNCLQMPVSCGVLIADGEIDVSSTKAPVHLPDRLIYVNVVLAVN